MDSWKLAIENLPGFLAALIGAVVGGVFVIRATRMTIREQYALEERREEREIEALLAAIRVEIDALWTFHMKRVGNLVESLKDGEALEFYYPLTQDYFTIYDTNADKIGKICDDDLRAAIVRCYNKCKKSVDGYKYNNELYRAYIEACSLPEVEVNVRLREARRIKLQELARIIREDHFELKGYIEELLRLLYAHESGK